MEIAAVASFAALLIAWIAAPDQTRTTAPQEMPAAETEPIAA